MSADAFLELRDVTKRYGAAAALEDVTLAVPRGSRAAVVGPSGSGKSTLLRIVAGFDAPDSGQVRLDGAVLADGPRIVPPHRRGIGLVAQEGALFPHLSVADNIGFGVPRRAPGRDGLVQELAHMVGLDAAMLARKPDALSGGQQQRVALARALACRPRLMLLDEPFSALDAGLREGTRTAVAELLGRAGVTTVLVTHDQQEAMTFAHQVAVLHQGRLLQAGPPRELYVRPCNEMVARFLGDAVVLPAELDGGWATCVLGRIGLGQGRDARPGKGRIMLRPEQLSLAPPRRAEGCEEDAAGTVQRVEFAGPSCAVTVRLRPGGAPGGHGDRGGQGGPVLLTVRTAQNAAPREGEVVRIRVTGEAHLL